MKIDSHSLPHSASPAERLESAAGSPGGTRKPAATGAGDRAQISPDAAFIGAAIRQAQDAPVLRQEVIERARQLLAAGDIGRDTVRLADSLINHLLES